jgi:hypothetical protein
MICALGASEAGLDGHDGRSVKQVNWSGSKRLDRNGGARLSRQQAGPAPWHPSRHTSTPSVGLQAKAQNEGCPVCNSTYLYAGQQLQNGGSSCGAWVMGCLRNRLLALSTSVPISRHVSQPFRAVFSAETWVPKYPQGREGPMDRHCGMPRAFPRNLNFYVPACLGRYPGTCRDHQAVIHCFPSPDVGRRPHHTPQQDRAPPLANSQARKKSQERLPLGLSCSLQDMITVCMHVWARETEEQLSDQRLPNEDNRSWSR